MYVEHDLFFIILTFVWMSKIFNTYVELDFVKLRTCVELFVKFNTCVAFNVVKLDVCMREFFVILKMCRMRIFEARHGFREILNMCGNRFCDIKLCV